MTTPWNLQMTQQLVETRAQQLRSARHQTTAKHQYQPSTLPSPPQSISPPSSSELSAKHHTPSTPKQRTAKRHHRTATPEQRQIRAYTNAPIYTMGIDPQNDRGLLCDFFEAIKTWSAAYTIHPSSITAEQLHSHPAIQAILGDQASSIIAEKTMLPAVVAAIVSRYIFSTTISEHALSLSAHPHAPLTEQLAREWSTLPSSNTNKIQDLLVRQRDIYTAIASLPTHKSWRAHCASTFSTSLLHLLSNLLIPLIPAEAIHVLQELFIKASRISFRLRMSTQRWDFVWPVPGQIFDGGCMVNESRMLYGGVLETMDRLKRGEHGVRFSVSPVVVRREWVVGGERSEVVHSSLVHVERRQA